MKSYLVLFFAFTVSIFVAKSQVKYNIGSEVIRIPTPKGFTESSDIQPKLFNYLAKNQAPGMEIIGLYITDEFLRKMEESDEFIPFYLVLIKEENNAYYTNEKFLELRETLKKQLNKQNIIELLEKKQENIKDIYKEFFGFEPDYSQPINLGTFNEQSDCLSWIIMQKMEDESESFVQIIAMSIIYIKGRLLNTWVVKRKENESDILLMKQFAEIWSEDIIYVNNGLDPSGFDNYYNLGITNYKKGRKQIEVALSIPANENNRYESEIAKANIWFEKALPYYEKCYKIRPYDKEVINNLKNIYYRLKMMDDYNNLKAR